jgi:hypothetical protein
MHAWSGAQTWWGAALACHIRYLLMWWRCAGIKVRKLGGCITRLYASLACTRHSLIKHVTLFKISRVELGVRVLVGWPESICGRKVHGLA